MKERREPSSLTETHPCLMKRPLLVLLLLELERSSAPSAREEGEVKAELEVESMGVIDGSIAFWNDKSVEEFVKVDEESFARNFFGTDVGGAGAGPGFKKALLEKTAAVDEKDIAK